MRYDDRAWGGRRRSPGGAPRMPGGYDGMMRGANGGRAEGPGARGYGRDFWWLGERAMPNRGRGYDYDQRYRRFDELNRPRYSPVGGMYGPIGGQRGVRRHPRPLAEPTRFSDWTRWF